MLQALFITLSILVVVAIVLLFSIKAGLQLKYLRMKKGQKAGKMIDFFRFDISDKKARSLRWEAFLLFPMLYAVVYDDKRQELNEIKRKVKLVHVGIYLSLIALVVLGIYSEKVFPGT